MTAKLGQDKEKTKVVTRSGSHFTNAHYHPTIIISQRARHISLRIIKAVVQC